MVKPKRKHPPLPAKMKPWKPGQTGNPNGRPPTAKCIPDILRSIGDDLAPPSLVKALNRIFPHKDFTGLVNRDCMLWRCYFDAEEGDSSSREFIADRTEGKIRQPIDLGFDSNQVQVALNLSAESAPEPINVDADNNVSDN